MKRISKWLAVFGVVATLGLTTSAFAGGGYGFSFGYNSGYRHHYYPRYSYSYGYSYCPPRYYYPPPVRHYSYCPPRYYYQGGNHYCY